MKLVQVNGVLNLGSTGRIAEQIGDAAMRRGHTSVVAFGRRRGSSSSSTVRIGGVCDVLAHGVESALFDRQGLGSRRATAKFIRWLEEESPDAIALHNIHGYYINYPALFDFLKRSKLPVMWTLHDCWPVTGHCAHYNRFDCLKWQDECFDCPMTRYYPTSLTDFSRRNFGLKKQTFRGHSNLAIVTPSSWLQNVVERSFMSDYPVYTINNGIDLDVFKPEGDGKPGSTVLGVANVWSESKGLADFCRLRSLLPSDVRIVLIGVSKRQIRRMPDGIEAVEKTEDIGELVHWYRRASVFVNPTYSDNFPTTNLEALGCGVPVVTYDTGGSAEAVDTRTGRVVRQGDVTGLANAILELLDEGDMTMRHECRERAEARFDRSKQYDKYIDLIESRVNETSG